jgi:hypothetical protein
MIAEHPGARSVERACGYALCCFSTDPSQTTDHLRGGLVGECDREYRIRFNLACLYQVRGTTYQHSRLAAPGSREDKDLASWLCHSRALLAIQFPERLDTHPASSRRLD